MGHGPGATHTRRLTTQQHNTFALRLMDERKKSIRGMRVEYINRCGEAIKKKYRISKFRRPTSQIENGTLSVMPFVTLVRAVAAG